MFWIIAAILLTKRGLILANGLQPIIVSLASFLLGWGILRRAKTARVSCGLTSMVRNLALAPLLVTTFLRIRTIATMLAYALLMFIVAFVIAAWFRRTTPALERAVRP